MINRVSKAILIALFSLCNLYSYGQCEAKIKDFYVSYMQNAEKNEDANAELLKANMLPELIAKINEYTRQYGADGVIHAQDICEYCIQSLMVVPQKDNWYLVKYKWSPQSDYTYIPVKAIDTDGKFIILDISPTDTCDMDENYNP